MSKQLFKKNSNEVKFIAQLQVREARRQHWADSNRNEVGWNEEAKHQFIYIVDVLLYKNTF